MTISRLSGIKAIALGAALSMTAGLALAGDNVISADQISKALQPKPLTRGLSAGGQQVDPAVEAKEAKFVNSLRNRPTRSLSLGEREEVAQLAANKPKIDLEIRFDYNSADIAKTSVQAVQELGKALSDPSLKGSTFVVAGHTDAVGGEEYNQGLSERRADTIKKLSDREVRHQRHRPRHRRLRQDQAEGCERADGSGQPPRPGGQYGSQQDRRRSNDASTIRPPIAAGGSPQPGSRP